MTLKEMREADIRFTDKSRLTDLRTITVPRKANGQADLDGLLQKTENLYQYRVGSVAVEFDYLPNGRTISDAFRLMMQAGS